MANIPQALVLIDIQNDYFPGGRMALAGSEAAGRKAGQLLDMFRTQSLPVFHVQHFSTRPGAGFFLPGTDGAEIHESVKPVAGEAIVPKNYPNAFRETALLESLRRQGSTGLVVAGMMTQMCVDTTVRAAFDLGFSVTLAHDACATRDLSFAGRNVAAADVQTAYIGALHGLFAKAVDADSVHKELA